MPIAAASFDDALDFDEPARKKGRRKARAGAPKGTTRKKGRKPRRFPVDMQRVSRYAAVGMSATVAVAIMVNALMLQKGHHPAPLFGKAIALGPSPAPPPRVATARAAPPAASAAPSLATAPPASMPTAGGNPEPTAATPDPIAQLIEGHAPAAQSKADTRTVMGAQRALAKLGFALKPSGSFGPQTRKAIEAFERDRHLPVNGELTHRLIKTLAAESGVKID